MKKQRLQNILILMFILSYTVNSCAQNPVNWTNKQLMQPAYLANAINTKKNVPLMINVGVDAVIPNSIDAGAVSKDGTAKLKTQLQNIPKNKKLVIYCGCCPFEHCPNIRPAIDVLNEMKFTNFYLLNLPDNIRKDWIDKGYPVAKS